MTAFPALRPSARSWTPGTRPITTYTAMSGREIRFRHSDRPVNQRLTLAYNNVAESVGVQITNHYETVKNTTQSFTLPAQVFAGMDNFSYTLAVGNEWRYGGPPSVEYIRPGYQTVTLELIGVVATD
jgi:hypothetical protein